VNERIAELTKEFALDGAVDSPIQVFCECGAGDCMTPIETMLSEYEAAVRAGPGRWVVSSRHIDELADSVMAHRNGYARSTMLPLDLKATRQIRGRGQHRLRRQTCPSADPSPRGLRAGTPRTGTRRRCG
jgi:hypothetical protein